MNKLIFAAVLTAPLIILQPIWAHTDESLDAMSSPHGGQVRAAGPYHLELVAKDGELVLHVTDHAWKEISKLRVERGRRIFNRVRPGAK